MTEEEQKAARCQLRTERERQQLSQESIATQLNLSLKTVNLLESNEFSSLPPPTFTRGYLRAYAKLLGIDDGDLMEVYNEYAPADPNLGTTNHVVKDTKSSHPAVRWATLSIVVVISTLLVFWWIGPRYGIDDASEFEMLSDQAVDEPRSETPAPLEIAEPRFEGESTSQSEGDTVQSDGAQVSTAAANDVTAEPVLIQSEDVASEDAQSEDVASEDVASEDVQSETVQSETVQSETVQSETVQIDRKDVLADTEQAQQQNEPPIGQMSESEEVESGPTVATIAGSEISGISEGRRTVAVTSDSALGDIMAVIAADTGELMVAGDDELQIQADAESWVEVIDANGVRLMYDMLTKNLDRKLRGTAPFKVFLGNTPGISMTMNGITVATPKYNSISNTSRFFVDADGSQRRQR